MSINTWPKPIFHFIFRLIPLALISVAFYMAWPAVDSLRAAAESLECYCPSCPADLLPESGQARLGLIRADVAGAVVEPGIYELDLGSRQADLLSAAGGLSDDASQVYIAKTFNSSTVLSDGDKLYFPYAWEEEWQLTAKSSGGSSTKSVDASSVVDSSNGLISINQASASDLETLPGIGEKRAEDIINARPYAKLEDLVEQSIVSETVFGDIKALISL